MSHEFISPEGDQHEAVDAAEAIVGGTKHAPEQQYALILPTQTIGVLTKTLFEYIDVHRDPVLQNSPMREEAQIIVNPENPHVLLFDRLNNYPKASELTLFSVSSSEVDILTEAVLFDISSRDPQGYEWYISEEDIEKNKRKGEGFIDFLQAYAHAGGDEKPKHIAEILRSIGESEDDQLRSQGWM
jgi:hypothetical protein